MKSAFIVISLLFFAAFVDTSAARSRQSLGEPPCSSWTRADVVFYGKALKTEAVAKGDGFSAGSRKIVFQVLENFKGADNPTFTLVHPLSSGSGVETAPIKKGETWIVYAKTDIVGKSFATFRAAKIEPKQTSAELETLKNVIAGKTSTAVTGQLTSSPNVVYKDAPVEVTVEGGGKRFSVLTDAQGAFHIPVTDGSYRVELRFPFRAAVKWDENLLGTSLAEGLPTVFKYDVRLNDGDCHFGFFEVSNAGN